MLRIQPVDVLLYCIKDFTISYTREELQFLRGPAFTKSSDVWTAKLRPPFSTFLVRFENWFSAECFHDLELELTTVLFLCFALISKILFLSKVFSMNVVLVNINDFLFWSPLDSAPFLIHMIFLQHS